MSVVQELHAGLKHSESVVVEKQLTVPEISPLFPAFTIMPHIFATPHLISLVESTCIIALRPDLTPQQRTVGVSFNFKHLAPTPVGMVVHCDCELTAVEDRRLHFTARVYDDVTEIAAATHERYIVDNERFTRKANSKLTAQS